jgi:hypothetical protein
MSGKVRINSMGEKCINNAQERAKKEIKKTNV